MNPIRTIAYRSEAALTKRSLKTLGRNSWALTKHFLGNAAQDHAGFKTNAVIFSSGVIVSTRSVISSNSALEARGTPDAEYRQTEAVGTIVRELSAFFASFITFRLFYNLTRKMLAKHLVTNPGEGSVKRFKQLRQDLSHELKAFWHRGQQAIESVTGDFKSPAAQKLITEMPQHKGLQKLIGFFGFNTQDVAKKIKQTYDVLPIVAGAVPVVAISGFLLEEFTLQHSKEIYNHFSRWLLGHGKPKIVDEHTLSADDIQVSRGANHASNLSGDVELQFQGGLATKARRNPFAQ